MPWVPARDEPSAHVVGSLQCAHGRGVDARACQGFAASGKTSPDKSPIVFLPHGARLSTEEGFGEGMT